MFRWAFPKGGAAASEADKRGAARTDRRQQRRLVGNELLANRRGDDTAWGVHFQPVIRGLKNDIPPL